MCLQCHVSDLQSPQCRGKRRDLHDQNPRSTAHDAIPQVLQVVFTIIIAG